MAVAEGLGLCHLLPNADPFSGLHPYATNLTNGDAELIIPNPELQLPSSCRTLMLHYSGYGYAPNGAPKSLVRQCSAWRTADPQRRLLVVFHELFARQPPWRKGFWWGHSQRQVVRRLALAADSNLSTLQLHTTWLRSQGFEPFATLAVPSGVGESPQPSSWSTRKPILVVFGGRAQRKKVYEALRRRPFRLDSLGIQSIIDVGPSLPDRPITSLPVKLLGALPSAEVAALLADSTLGAVAYPWQFLAKSSIFAALCAHGCTPLVFNAGLPHSPTPDRLQKGREFLDCDQLNQLAENASTEACKQVASRIAANAWKWYQSHRVSEQRQMVQRWISEHQT